LHLMNNKKLRVFYGSGAAIEGVPAEGQAGVSRATAHQGGDARFMAVDCLAMLGEKAASNKEVMEALERAAKDPDETLRKHAEKALKDLRKKD
jgi:hypothetical protein